MHSALNRSAALVAALVASAGAGLADEADILLCSPAAYPDQLATGVIHEDGGGIFVPVRVFESAVELVAGDDVLLGDVGFFAVSDPNLLPDGFIPPPGTTDLRFDFNAFELDGVTRNLWYWDPAIDPDPTFGSPPPAGARVQLQKSPISIFTATVDGAASDVAGFTIDRTSSSGALHRHLTLRVDDADNDLGTLVPTGIYVIRFTVSHAGGAAPPVFDVINAGLGAGGQEHVDAAVAYFEALLAPECPGDVDGSGAVDLDDLLLVLGDIGGAYDLDDLLIVLGQFGASCE